MPRRRVTAGLNRLAELPLEIFQEVMRYVLNVFTKRLHNYNDYNLFAGIYVPYDAPSEQRENMVLRQAIRQAAV